MVNSKLSQRIRYLLCPKQLWDFPMIYVPQDSLDSLGNGRAFCAGGDVTRIFHDIAQGDWRAGADFFRMGFTVIFILATHNKSQVSFLNGLVMGAGASAALHGKFQVVTENTLFAMPETTLGSFPDLGASYYLSRLPGFFGEYLGLTGARLNGAEMLACGLVTHFVPSAKLSSLEEALEDINTTDPFVISSTITKFSEVPNLKEKSAYHRLNIINKCFSQRTVEDIIAALEVEYAANKEDWISFSIRSLKKASPISLKITLRSIREGRLQGIVQCLVREFRMISHVFQGKISKDFYEGCRAILLDKDQNPKWEPWRIELITKEMVDWYFKKVEDDDWSDLNLTAHAIAKL